MLEGQRTAYFTDIKLPIRAGMPLGKKSDNKIRKVGYEIIRLYYDSELKDWQVGGERIKRVLAH